MTEPKPRIAVWKFTGCAGCQMEILRLDQNPFLDLLSAVDIDYFKMVEEASPNGPFDVSFVEGSISTTREIREIKEVRSKSKILVALGDCAVNGCIPSIRNWMPQRNAESVVYKDISAIDSVRVYGIDEYVPVDYFLRGCPPHREMFLSLVKAVLLNVKPFLRPHSVCVECKMRENICLITSKMRACMGPVTRAGCGAICPSADRECEGCYGPMSDANPSALVKEFRERCGLSSEEVVRKFRKYAGTTAEFGREAGI